MISSLPNLTGYSLKGVDYAPPLIIFDQTLYDYILIRICSPKRKAFLCFLESTSNEDTQNSAHLNLTNL